MGKAILCLAISNILFFGPTPQGQSLSVSVLPSEGVTSRAVSGSGFEQSEKLRTFGAASIRLSDSNSSEEAYISPAGTGRFRAVKISLQTLVGMAYGIPQKHILQQPKWFESQAYTIDSVTDDGKPMTAQERQIMLRALLKERFHLVTHFETNIFPGYALVAANGKKSNLRAGDDGGSGYIVDGQLSFPGITMESLAALLERLTGRPCVDKTQMEGRYKIKLDYAPMDDPDSTLPSLFTALQEQLGLKLTPDKVPVKELAIDSVDRVPTEN